MLVRPRPPPTAHNLADLRDGPTSRRPCSRQQAPLTATIADGGAGAAAGPRLSADRPRPTPAPPRDRAGPTPARRQWLRRRPRSHRVLATRPPGQPATATTPRCAAGWSGGPRSARSTSCAVREYFPGALEAFPSLAHGDALGLLATAPGPREAARLSSTQIRASAAPRRPPAQHRAARRRGPRSAALPAAWGAAAR